MKSSSARFERAKPYQLKRIFNKYASVDLDGEKYMTSDDFIRRYLGLLSTPNYNKTSLSLLAGILDTSKDGLISYLEFQAFEKLLCVPDALYFTAFQLFDTSGNGLVSFDEFEEIISHTTLQQSIPFDMNSPFVQLYFGKKKDRVVTYPEFSQFLHDFHEEYSNAAFQRFDADQTGFISSENFEKIMLTIRSHIITPVVAPKLKELVKGVTGDEKVSFPFFAAFNFLLNNMELIKKVYLLASKGDKNREITKEEFFSSAQTMSHVTPLQIDILFKLCELIHQSPTIILSDLQSVAPEQYYRKVNQRILDVKAVSDPGERGLFIEFLESVYRFIIGTIAGGFEAIAVYPMDLVKTRMQLQRPSKHFNWKLYKNNYDCFYRTYKNEGTNGLYRGLVPQIIGVSLGKALKLSMNDYVRDKLMNRKGIVPLWGQVAAGACAGACNVVIINPLEVIKIQVQVAGERNPNTNGTKTTLPSIIRQLGISGLYKGSIACLLRDVPFSAIFFPMYAYTKERFQDVNGYNSPWSLLAAGFIATLPGAPLSMPFDVIKTRLQSAPRPGQTEYTGVRDAAKKILREEGLRAFWQGTRVIKPSQFGMTLLLYEVLQRLFYIDFAGTRPSGSEANILVTSVDQVKSDNPDHIGGYALALPILSGIESKFGLVFPKFAPSIEKV